MSLQRAALRSVRPTNQQLTRSSRRTPLQRRFASSTDPEPGLHGSENNAFNRERQAVKHHAAATSGLWRKLSIYAVVPAVVIAAANAYVLWNQHWEHWAHEPALEERIEYPYQNVRTKSYPWGDGDKTLFWNKNVNYHHKDE